MTRWTVFGLNILYEYWLTWYLNLTFSLSLLYTYDSRKLLTEFRHDVVAWLDSIPQQVMRGYFVNPIKRLPHISWVLS